MLLVAQVTLQPFEKWVMDFVGPVNPPGRRTSAQYIIIEIDYLTRWEEAMTVMDCTIATEAKFIFENILTRFGCPRILMSDHGSHFINRTMKALIKESQVYIIKAHLTIRRKMELSRPSTKY